MQEQKQSDSYHRLDRQKNIWTESEKNKLLNLYHQYGYISNEIIELLPGRSLHACRNMMRRLKQKRLFQNTDKSSYTKINHKQIDAKQFNNRYWTIEQEKKLLQLAEDLQFNWDQVAKQFKNCSGYNCFQKYKNLKMKKKNFISQQKKVWTQTQKRILIDQYNKIGNKWQQIASCLPGRTVYACRNTFHRIKDNKMPNEENGSDRILQIKTKSLNDFKLSKMNSTWTKEEDQRLLELKKQYKADWDKICLSFQNYDAYNCYQRYKYIKAQQKKWTIQDQNKLMYLYELYNTKWSKITKQFGNKKSKISCCNKIKRMKTQSLKVIWSQQQLQQLMKLHKIKKGNWEKIQKKLSKFTLKECFFKFYQNLQKNKEKLNKINRKDQIDFNIQIIDFEETWMRNILKQLEILVRISN